MPIRPDLRRHYAPPAWPEIRRRILDRAGNRCEECGAPNGALGRRADSTFYKRGSIGNIVLESLGHRLVCIQIGVAHLDHDPTNNSDANLRALCRRCHLIYDKRKHRDTRAGRKDADRPLLRRLSQ